MPFDYKIIYNIRKDMQQWRECVGGSFMGNDTIDNIDNAADRKIADQIIHLRKPAAEQILKPYLMAQQSDPNSKLNKFITIATDEFRNKFTDACLAIERITKRPLAANDFTFYITTFPCMSFYYDTRIFYMYDSIEGVWGMPIDGFLHEVLHYQFIHYWQFDDQSPVSKLDDDSFHYLKEALSVILDEELKPIITLPDCSYPQQKAFRDVLHKYWKQHHDFDTLVAYGLEKLPDFISL